MNSKYRDAGKVLLVGMLIIFSSIYYVGEFIATPWVKGIAALLAVALAVFFKYLSFDTILLLLSIPVAYGDFMLSAELINIQQGQPQIVFCRVASSERVTNPRTREFEYFVKGLCGKDAIFSKNTVDMETFNHLEAGSYYQATMVQSFLGKAISHAGKNDGITLLAKQSPQSD